MIRLTIFWRRRCWVLSAAGICERRLFGKTAKQESWFGAQGFVVFGGYRREEEEVEEEEEESEC